MKCMRLLMGLLVCATAAVAQHRVGDVHVTVVDESGAPIAGAEVHCVSWNNGPRTTPLEQHEQGITDANGKVSFQEKYLGQSFVRVIHGRLGGWFRMHETMNDATVATITPGLGRTVRGKVTDRQGKPIANVLVSVDGCLPAAVTDEFGLYAVPNVGASGYSSSDLGFYKDGFAAESVSPRDDMKSVDVTLMPGVSISGTVRDLEGMPLGDANITTSTRHDPVRSAPDGTFKLFGVPIHEDVTVYANHFREEPHRYLQGKHSVSVGDVAPEPIVISMTDAALEPRPEPRVITGSVIRQDTGKPVTAQMFSGSDASNASSNPGATDQQGVFVIDNNVHGVHHIGAKPINPVLYVLDGPVAVDASKGSVDNVQLRVVEGCAIRGRVIFEDGSPVANTHVSYSPANHFYPPITTRADGRFTLSNLEVLDTVYTLSVRDALGRNRSIEVGPLKKGELREGVEIVLPAPIEPRVLRGTVRSIEGEPIPNVRVMFSYQRKGDHPSLDWPVTDDDGRFEVKVVESGTVKISASTSVFVGSGDSRYDTQQFFNVVGQDEIELDASKDSELNLTLALRGVGVLQGRVMDDNGTGILAQVRIIHGESGKEEQEYGNSKEDGYFVFQHTPEPPFLLEISKSEYKTRILAIDSKMKHDEKPLTITLARGPFAIGESVWSAVTGLPATDAAVEALPLSAYVRTNEARYYNEALPRPAPKPDVQPLPQQLPLRTRFLDPNGKPVTSIFVLPVQSLYTPEMAQYFAPRGNSAKALSSEDGIYALHTVETGYAYGWVAWAEGMGRVAGNNWHAAQQDSVQDVVLYPACTVTLSVKNSDGSPAANEVVGAPELAWERGDHNVEVRTVAKTNSDGVVTFESLSPGTHAFAIGNTAATRRLVLVHARQGDANAFEVTLTTDTKDPQWLLQTWRTETGGNNLMPEEAGKQIAALDRKVRDALAAHTHKQLELLTNIRTDNRNRYVVREQRLLTGIAAELKDATFAPVFRAALRAPDAQPLGYETPDHTAAGAMAQAIIAIEDENSVSFFAEVAADPNAAATSRQAAIQALGRIGTPSAAETFASLRDAARALPNAPAEKERYTHNERIAETIRIVRLILHGQMAADFYGIENPLSATISADYKTADAWAGGTGYKLVRIGDEWLINEFGGTVMP